MRVCLSVCMCVCVCVCVCVLNQQVEEIVETSRTSVGQIIEYEDSSHLGKSVSAGEDNLGHS